MQWPTSPYPLSVAPPDYQWPREVEADKRELGQTALKAESAIPDWLYPYVNN